LEEGGEEIKGSKEDEKERRREGTGKEGEGGYELLWCSRCEGMALARKERSREMSEKSKSDVFSSMYR
jgi:hypothetical protein